MTVRLAIPFAIATAIVARFAPPQREPQPWIPSGSQPLVLSPPVVGLSGPAHPPSWAAGSPTTVIDSSLSAELKARSVEVDAQSPQDADNDAETETESVTRPQPGMELRRDENKWGPRGPAYPGGDGGGRGGGWGGGGSGDGGNPFAEGGPGGSGSGRGGQGGQGFGQGGVSSFLGFDVEKAMYLRSIHGILGAVAFVGIFPVGAILMRIVPGRLSVWVHALAQIIGFATYVAAAGLGIYLVKTINIRGTSLLELRQVNFHPIIGLVILGGLLLQPIFGIIHHIQYRRLRRRQIWSYFHLWIGRIFITLGIINGGLGLWVANASNTSKIAYGVVAGIVWLVWMLVAFVSERRRGRAATTVRTAEKRRVRT